ncbi:hypothetical protein [Streptomyces sp. col6]|uniref:hypothetical protein n=1 Tax=Streptomyces sp. col6 TaxID=2478958 RepID=UPI001CD18C50|nr:hypothetical protein [Streptomyces sp. col6]
MSDLSGIVCDYPSEDPAVVLTGLAADTSGALTRHGTPAGRRELTGYTVLLHATSWYATSGRILNRPLLDAYADVLNRIRATFAPAVCRCALGHPSDILSDDREHMVEFGVSLLTTAGREIISADYGVEDNDIAVLDCPAFLSDLADTAKEVVHGGIERLFGEIDVSHLDAAFLRNGGRIEFTAVQDALSRTWEDNAGPVGLWCARRWLAGQVNKDERIGVMLCMRMVIQNSYEGLPPSYSRVMQAALKTVDLNAACSHPIHPWSAVADRRAAVLHLCAPAEHPDSPVPPELSARELWECPGQYLELARAGLRTISRWNSKTTPTAFEGTGP